MTFKALWPSLLTVLMLIVTTFSPQLQVVISAHPTLAAVVAAVYAIFSHLMPSPAAPAVK